MPEERVSTQTQIAPGEFGAFAITGKGRGEMSIRE